MNNQTNISLSQADIEHQHRSLGNYKFSSDEVRVLRECNTEAFFQRSLPLGTSLGIAAYFGVHQGYLRPNAKYGAIPKVVVGVIVGYFLGKFSYQQRCVNKIMKLPNSRLAEALRLRKQVGLMETLAPDNNNGVGFSLSPFTPNSSDVYSDEYTRKKGNHSFDMEIDSRPSVSGLDDMYRPSLDNPTPQFEPDIQIGPSISGITYDQMRMKNRSEYLKKQPNLQSQETCSMETNEKPMFENELEGIQSKSQTNKYGDTWTN